MSLTNHGVWIHYVPDPWPERVPTNIMFAKRNADGKDWYAFSQGAELGLEADTAKYILSRADGASPWIVIQADRDRTRLFPQEGSLVLEDAADTGPDADITSRVGRVYQAGALVVVPPPVPPEPTLAEYAKDARWKKEVSNLPFAGFQVAMDDRSKSLILGGYISAQRNPAWTTVWQAEDGEVPVDATAITALFDAMQARINACFTTYSSVVAGISGGTITTTTAIDEAFASVT